jgi:hypothetical protein
MLAFKSLVSGVTNLHLFPTSQWNAQAFFQRGHTIKLSGRTSSAKIVFELFTLAFGPKHSAMIGAINFPPRILLAFAPLIDCANSRTTSSSGCAGIDPFKNGSLNKQQKSINDL